MRKLIAGIAIAWTIAASGSAAAADSWPTSGWQHAAPEEQGFASGKLADALLAVREMELDIHSLLILRGGEVVLDAYFYPYDGTTVHNLASVTKSVMTTLVAIAAGEGALDLDRPMLSYFPGRAVANRDARKERVTVRHLAMMASGLDCLSDPDEPTLHEMNASADWVQFTLDRKMVAEPGTVFVYCSPGMHLLSAILQQATGKTALEFAEADLFRPLGITETIWPADPQGVTAGWGDLHLHPHDMAKIGYLWLHGGEWQGRRIVSAEWVAQSSSLRIATGRDDDYGYGWWVMTGDAVPGYAAVGRGGQRIAVFPTLDTVVVTTGGGFEPSDVLDLVGKALVDPAKPLAPDPAGAARLAAALGEIARPPATRAVSPLPAAAQAVSGQTYAFEPNPLDLARMRVDFGDTAEATLALEFFRQPPRTGKVGLDGVYRFSPGENGLAVGIRGAWADTTTFLMEYDTVASIDAFDLRIRFDGDRVTIDARDRTYQSGVRLVGRAERTSH